jgi:putative flippase GtrA
MLGAHGSFRRYLLTASVNFSSFYLLFLLFLVILPKDSYWPTIAWSIAWLVGSFIAHWTHRIWTFHSQRDTKWTIPASMGLYTIGWIGSSACYYIGTVSWEINTWIVFFLNSSLWGVLNYIGQREIAFKEISTSPLS